MQASSRGIARRRRAPALVLACLCAATAVWGWPVPNLKFRDMAGHVVRLDSLCGHIAVVNFWATWCGPCEQELPRLSALRAVYARQGVEFVAVSVDPPKDFAKIQPYFKRHQIVLPGWTGARARLRRSRSDGIEVAEASGVEDRLSVIDFKW